MVSLTIYNSGTSLVREQRTIELQAGLNTLDVTDITSRIDAPSVTFRSLDDPTGTVVLEQNFMYDVVGGSSLLNRYHEQRLEITTDDGTIFAGRLVSTIHVQARALGVVSEIILLTDDGQVIYTTLNKIRDIRFPSLPGGLFTRPTLRWLLQSGRAGSQQVEITYLTHGMNWEADYNLLLAPDGKTFDLSGWITINNTSGATFTNAQVKLVAGELHRAQFKAQHQMDAGLRMYMARPEPQVEQRGIFEYQLYQIQRSVTLAQNETKQVEFVNLQHVTGRTHYVFRPQNDWRGYDHPLFTEPSGWEAEPSHVQTWLEFSTGEESGLGNDLPAGKVRVYQQDVDSAPVLIGEDTINHTPKGETLRIELGKSFDLVGERVQTDYRQIGKKVVEESFEIRIRNRKDDATVTIRVQERLFRWSNWEILKSSIPYTRMNAFTIEFVVEVPPGGESVVSYTVRYSWS